MQDNLYNQTKSKCDNVIQTLAAIAIREDDLNRELRELEDDALSLIKDESLSGSKPNGSLNLLNEKKVKTAAELSDLFTRGKIALDLKIGLETELRILEKEQLAKNKADALPKILEAFKEQKAFVEDALARLAALASISQGLPLTMLPAERVSRMLDTEVYRKLKQCHLEEVEEEHKLRNAYYG